MSWGRLTVLLRVLVMLGSAVSAGLALGMCRADELGVGEIRGRVE